MWGFSEKRISLLEDQVKRLIELEEAMVIKQGEKIDFIVASVDRINEQLQLDELQTEIKIAKAQEGTRNHVRDNYATRIDVDDALAEVDDGLASIRYSTRLIWLTIVACVAAVSWCFYKLL